MLYGTLCDIMGFVSKPIFVFYRRRSKYPLQLEWPVTHSIITGVSFCGPLQCSGVAYFSTENDDT